MQHHFQVGSDTDALPAGKTEKYSPGMLNIFGKERN